MFTIGEIKWGNDGLIPAIVQDFYNGRVLMLAYVNAQSLAFMQEKGETCFWSRSRQELWHKGATSGDVQIIKTMSLDCDNDTLLLQVEQMGKGACHTGSYSCFGEEKAAFNILERGEEIIRLRAAVPQKDSYTNYLLDKGLDKICKKIGEEAAETIIAAKNGDNTELTSEIADLKYHLLVLMHERGLSLRKIYEELLFRSVS